MSSSTSNPTESGDATEAHFRRLGILFIVSAPSGAGKSTILNALRQTPDFVYSVSCTTRAPPRARSRARTTTSSARKSFSGASPTASFLESAQCTGNYYGTLRSVVVEQLHDGVDVLIDIDVQGARQIREDPNPIIRDSVTDIFIMPPSLEELRRRLTKRGTETPEQIEIRLRNAALEMEVWRDYRYTIISGSVEEDLQKFRAIMLAEHYLSRRLTLLP